MRMRIKERSASYVLAVLTQSRTSGLMRPSCVHLSQYFRSARYAWWLYHIRSIHLTSARSLCPFCVCGLSMRSILSSCAVEEDVSDHA